MKKLSAKRRAYGALMLTLMGLCTALVVALVLFLIFYVLIRGIPNITPQLLFTAPSVIEDRIGILPDILNTLYLVLATLAIVLPLGVGAAIYLTEYAKNRKMVAVIEYAAETLSGIPSIIYGLVGMLLFCEFFGFGTSLWAGALTLVIMNLPTILRTTQESLKTVPQSYREGAFGLGGQMARDPHGGAAGLCGRHYHGLHSFRGQNFRRIGGAFVYGGCCAYHARRDECDVVLRGDADRGALYVCKGARRI